MRTPPLRKPDQARINEMIVDGRVIYFDTTLRLEGHRLRLVIGTDDAPELETA